MTLSSSLYPALYMVAILSPLLIGGCSAQSRHTMLVPHQNPKGSDCQIEIFMKEPPARQFERISRLDVHIERTYYVRSTFNDVLPELKKEACESGADAIIDIQERSSTFNMSETNIYHVTAIGIRFLP